MRHHHRAPRVRLARQNSGQCAATGKRRYTDTQAIAAALRRSARTGYPLRCYQCDACGAWHLTKRVVPLRIEKRGGAHE